MATYKLYKTKKISRDPAKSSFKCHVWFVWRLICLVRFGFWFGLLISINWFGMVKLLDLVRLLCRFWFGLVGRFGWVGLVLFHFSLFYFGPSPNFWTFKEPRNRFQGIESRARIFKILRCPRIDSKEPIPPGCVALAGRYDNLNHTRFLALMDCLKIPALGFLKVYKFGLWLVWHGWVINWFKFVKFPCWAKMDFYLYF